MTDFGKNGGGLKKLYSIQMPTPFDHFPEISSDKIFYKTLSYNSLYTFNHIVNARDFAGVF